MARRLALPCLQRAGPWEVDSDSVLPPWQSAAAVAVVPVAGVSLRCNLQRRRHRLVRRASASFAPSAPPCVSSTRPGACHAVSCSGGPLSTGYALVEVVHRSLVVCCLLFLQRWAQRVECPSLTNIPCPGGGTAVDDSTGHAAAGPEVQEGVHPRRLQRLARRCGICAIHCHSSP